jgi:hypothetical protein
VALADARVAVPLVAARNVALVVGSVAENMPMAAAGPVDHKRLGAVPREGVVPCLLEE